MKQNMLRSMYNDNNLYVHVYKLFTAHQIRWDEIACPRLLVIIISYYTYYTNRYMP